MNGNLGNSRHLVVQALQMLNVHGGVHVNARTQQFFDILIALFMAASVGIGMGKLVDQNNLGAALQRGIKVEFAQHYPFMLHHGRRNAFQSFKQCRRRRALVRLDIAHHHVKPLCKGIMRSIQHRVRFANACGIPEKYFQATLRLTPRLPRPS